MSTLTLSPLEVAHTFHLPLSAARSSERLREDRFRQSHPYSAVDVTDLIPSASVEHGAAAPHVGQHEVWGLTGWYLALVLRTLGLER